MSNRPEVVSLRLSADELATVQAAAAAELDTVSGFVRGRALFAAMAAEPGARVSRLPNGAPVVWNVHAPSGVTVTGP